MQLTVDDSVAQQQIESGVAKEVAETGEFAHAITKWLGRDAQDIVPAVAFHDITGPGWLLACSDGLWNYASEPAALAAQIAAAGPVDPGTLALKLVEFASSAGGHDNITAALARVGPLAPPPPPSPAAAETAATAAPADAPPAPDVPPPPPPVQNAGTPAEPTAPTTDVAGEGAPTDG